MTAPQASDPRTAAHGGRSLIPGAPSVPQVNLLPPEIRASRSLARVKQVLALALVGVLAVAVGGYFWATTQVQSAEQELADEQAESTRLLNEQKEYAEVPQVLGQLDLVKRARLVATATEIRWAPFILTVIGSAPTGVYLETFEFAGSTPLAAGTIPPNPLLDPEGWVGTVTWTGRAPQPVDAAAWIESLEATEGFIDAFVTSVEIAERDLNGQLTSYYEVSGTVQVTSDALYDRFAEETDEDGAEDDEDEEAQS